MPDDFRAVYAQNCMDIVRCLPRDQQQNFMNGVFGVSRAERQFAVQLMLQLAKQQKEQLKLLEEIGKR